MRFKRFSRGSARISDKPVPLFCSVRMLIAVMACLSLTVNYMQRVNLTLGIVRMVNHTAVSIILERAKLHNTEKQNDSNEPINIQKSAIPDGEFIWSSKKQGYLLSAYFYGYLLTQAIGGLLAFKLGAQRVLILSVAVSSIFTLLAPVAAKLSYTAIFADRFIIGLFASLNWPALLHLLGDWAPANERSRLISISNSGSQIGTIIALPLTGLLCSVPYQNGWPLTFYFTGVIGLIWTITWAFVARSKPEQHPFISEREKRYIAENKPKSTVKKNDTVPYKAIFTSIPCWGMFASHFFKAVGFYTILTNISIYTSKVLKFNLKSNGFLAALPYIFYWLNTILIGILADWIINTKKWTRTCTRKVFTGLGNFFPALFIMALSFVTAQNRNIAILLITLVLTTTGFNTGGGMYFSANDMAPKYAGIIWGISNTFGNLPGIICPPIVGILTKDHTVKEWRIVFIICAISYVISGLSFILTGTGEVQSWAKDADAPSEPIKPDNDAKDNAYDTDELGETEKIV